MTLSNSTLTLNRCTAAGGTGAISVVGGSLNVIHSTISANAGDTFGGGIFTQASLTVERSNRCREYRYRRRRSGYLQGRGRHHRGYRPQPHREQSNRHHGISRRAPAR